MSATATVTTDRLVLRAFSAADRTAFAAMNADPHVMRHVDHPQVPVGHRLRPHWFWRATAGGR